MYNSEPEVGTGRIPMAWSEDDDGEDEDDNGDKYLVWT